jgi:hypothetical protein
MDPFSTRVSDVLASSDFLQRHPGNSMLGSDLYSSASNSSSELILRQRYSGQYVSTANNLNFGSQSTFFLTPGSVMNGIVVSGAVTLPRYSRAPDLWALHAIDSIELVISGSSSVQSLKISGKSMVDYILCSTHSSKVEQLKQCCPAIDLNKIPGDTTIKFSVPLHLFFSSPEIVSCFPLDTSTLQSQILMNIRWKQVYNVFQGDSTNSVTLPSAFDDLYMRVGAQNQISNDFALANQLKSDASLVYSLPGAYLQTYSQVQNVSAVGVGASQNQIPLTSQPSGQLQMILMSAQAIASEGQSDTNGLIQPYAQFETIRVLYNGIELYRADSKEEIRLFNCLNTDKDSGVYCKLRAVPATTAGLGVAENIMSSVVIIPFVNETSKVLRERRHEHTKNYSGSTIQVFYTLSNYIDTFNNAEPVSGNQWDNKASPSSPILIQSAGDYRFNFTFVNSALYEISSQTVSMNM